MPEEIQNLFTSVRVLTRLDENGMAVENTLRFTRVVNRYLPKCISAEQAPCTFSAEILYDGDKEKILEDSIKAVRHIGIDRTRGLGNVRCSLEDRTIINESVGKPQGVQNPDEAAVIHYVIKNTGMLLLSSAKDDISESYIAGQSVLGALAGIYLQTAEITEPDDVFCDLFLSGKTIFGNLYPSDCAGNDYVPAPLFINRLKKTKKYVNVAIKAPAGTLDDFYNPDNGNQPKKLNGKYVRISNHGLSVVEPDADLVYHHTKKAPYTAGQKTESVQEDHLYAVEALEPGQYFAGEIITQKKYVNLLENLLQSELLRFGKSKSAQYGYCKCTDLSVKERQNEELKLNRGDKVLAVLESDLIVPGEYGYTTNYTDVYGFLGEKLGLEDAADAKCYMNAKLINGYNAKVNMKKAAIPSVAAGSAFEYEVLKDGVCPAIYYVGDRIAEGYGKIKIYPESEMGYALRESKLCISEKPAESSELFVKIKAEISRANRLEQAKKNFIDTKSKKVNINAALIDRVNLMLKESRNQEDELKDFAERIISIKRTRERETILRYLKEWRICEIRTRKAGGRLYLDQATPCVENADIWREYLVFILVHLKYTKSQEKKPAAGSKERKNV